MSISVWTTTLCYLTLKPITYYESNNPIDTESLNTGIITICDTKLAFYVALLSVFNNLQIYQNIH